MFLAFDSFEFYSSLQLMSLYNIKFSTTIGSKSYPKIPFREITSGRGKKAYLFTHKKKEHYIDFIYHSQVTFDCYSSIHSRF